jgi:hypothetical protein
MNKIIAYILIALGASDLLIWVFNGFSFGWLEFVVGVNVISKYGGWIMIAIGGAILNKISANTNAEQDKLDLNLEEGEEMIFSNNTTATIVHVSNKRLFFRNIDLTDQTIKENENVLTDSKIDFRLNEIKTCKPIKVKEIAKTKIGKVSGFTFGIQLEMTDGRIINISTTKADIISSHINKFL